MGLESPDSRFTEASKLLGEVESLTNSLEGIIICALMKLENGVCDSLKYIPGALLLLDRPEGLTAR